MAGILPSPATGKGVGAQPTGKFCSGGVSRAWAIYPNARTVLGSRFLAPSALNAESIPTQARSRSRKAALIRREASRIPPKR